MILHLACNFGQCFYVAKKNLDGSCGGSVCAAKADDVLSFIQRLARQEVSEAGDDQVVSGEKAGGVDPRDVEIAAGLNTPVRPRDHTLSGDVSMGNCAGVQIGLG